VKLRTHRRTIALAGALMTLALGTAACGGDDAGTGSAASPSATESSAMTPSTSASESMAPSTAAMAAGEEFGPGCAAVPADGAGSFAGMAQAPVATAASANPELSTLVQAVTAAELVDTLNSTDNLTVFAPANSAFAAMDQATLQTALADPKGLLTTVLTYHVVPGRLAPEALAGTHKTLQGAEVMVEGSGENFTVGGADAKVVCGNVQTSNATVYIIDGVLMPPAA
jgi:uncharacterized surface protein with fasciclin (FAS1) repeats